MINCIYTDKEKKNHAAAVQLINNIKEINLAGSFASLAQAYKICKARKIDIVFVRLYLVPLPEIRKEWIRKIEETGTKVIVISTRITLASYAFTLNANYFILWPTTTGRLWKACLKVLESNDPDTSNI